MALGDFPIDLNAGTVLYKGKREPGPGHPRRCQAKAKKLGLQQCTFWAMRDSFYCAAHAGSKSRRTPLKSLYALQASERLRDILNRVSEDASLQTSLKNEIDMARALTTQAVADASARMFDPETSPADKERAYHTAIKAMDAVAGLMNKNTLIASRMDTNLTAEQAAALVSDMGKIINARLTPDDGTSDAVRKLLEKIRANVMADLADLSLPKKRSIVHIGVT